MKKIILSLVFIFATGTTFMNANSYKKTPNFEELSCLMNAFNQTNALEAESPGGSYSWTHEQWTATFQLLIGVCNALEADD